MQIPGKSEQTLLNPHDLQAFNAVLLWAEILVPSDEYLTVE